MTEEEKLNEIRRCIDAIDEQLQKLLNRRAEAAMGVAQIKLAADPNAVFYRPEREAQVLRMVKTRNRGPLPDEEMGRLFREIMSACLALERPLKVAYLGPEGTFTQAAALKYFGHSVRTQILDSISDVFQKVESEKADYGVVPVENSSEGIINHTLDMFLSSPLQICGEVSLRIHHNLLGKAQPLGSIRTVFSHQQSLAQCRGWLDRHLPFVERMVVGSNAEAARLAAETDGAAAIAGRTAADIYDLKVLAADIEDEPDNTTRFLVIGQHGASPSGDDKTSIMVGTRNEAGALYHLLRPLAENGINMTRIESRPSRRGNWDYVFFIDLLGHHEDPGVDKALAELRSLAVLYKELGSYPRAVL